MNNQVVYDLFHMFVRRGFSVLRFNFRGVGRSQGSFDHGLGELSDAAAALDWMQQHNPNSSSCWVAGFSFGAWIGMQLLMRRPEIDGFLSVAPPANMYDFSFLAPCPSSGLIVHGDNDALVPPRLGRQAGAKLSQQRGIKIDLEVIPRRITSSAAMSRSSAGRSSAISTRRSATSPRPRWRKPGDEPASLGVRAAAGRARLHPPGDRPDGVDARAADGR